MENKEFIELSHINKVYSNSVQAVYDFSLNIERNDFVVLVGPSGCGKSTTLRMIAGLEEITSGELYLDGVLSNFVESKNRNIAMVFQSYALYPNMNVYENMAFGLRVKGLPNDEIEERVFNAAKILDLGDYLDRKPKELSGGQMQRVALGRAIVRKAPIFLMDEPLSNLDAKLRISMRAEIAKIHRQVESTTIYVTHDQVEAMTMATKIVVMNKGFVQQIGSPEEIYNEPKNSFVATFIGTPAMNTFMGKYSDGFLYLGDYKVNEINTFKEKHDAFYQEELKNITPFIENFSLDSLTYLKRLFSNRITLNKEKKVNMVTKKSLSNLFKATRKEEEEVNKELTELIEVQTMLKDCLSTSHEILVGLRPEQISLIPVSEVKSTDGEIIVTASVVELLGAEYNIYFDFLGKTLICKVGNQRKIRVGDSFILRFESKDLYLYDVVTGHRITID